MDAWQRLLEDEREELRFFLQEEFGERTMANYVAGHVDDPDAMDSCIGIEFEPENNQAVVYINEEEISLTYEQVKQLDQMAVNVISQMEWHNASWVYAQWLSTDKYHLMKKGQHGEMKRTLCGQVPPGTRVGWSSTGWHLAPVIKEPWRTSSTCQRCLKIYDKRTKEQGNEK